MAFCNDIHSLNPCPVKMELRVLSPPGRHVSSPVLNEDIRVVHKVVLTGGPCGGKTTTASRLRSFFETLGWKVFNVTEAATILLGGGVTFSELSLKQVDLFQENIIRTIIQLEKVYDDLAKLQEECVLIICDRGVMDPSAYCSKDAWGKILQALGTNEIDLRDKRYHQVIHMVTAANGAEKFYSLDNNATRSESPELARELDTKVSQAWVGHPYLDIVDNSTNFEKKILRVIEAVCMRLFYRVGVELVPPNRFSSKNIKRKFLVQKLPPLIEFPSTTNFTVQHDYLHSSEEATEARIRKRGSDGHYMYTHTICKIINSEKAETRMQITAREYDALMSQRDQRRHPIYKVRHCFLWKGNYFQLDQYTNECPDSCKGLLLLETFTANTGDDLELPQFLKIVREVTGDPCYSMYNLSLMEEYKNVKPNDADNSVPPPKQARIQ